MSHTATQPLVEREEDLGWLRHLIADAATGHGGLAVVAGEDADPGVVGHQMMELVEQIGDHLRAEPRTEAAGSGTS